MNPIDRRNDLNILVTPSDIKTYTNLSPNVNDLTIRPVIFLCQRLYVQTVLGDTLYNKLMVEWDNANRVPADLPDGTLGPDTTNYKELYQEFYQALIWWSYTHLIFVNGVKIEEKGVMLNQSDYSENGGFELIRQVENRVRSVAQTYQDKFTCYVKDTFKEDEDVKVESKSNGTTFSGMYFPNKVKTCKSC